MVGLSVPSSGSQSARQANAAFAAAIEKVTSGKNVNSAADNAAYWSIATTMMSDHKAISTVGDALALGAATADTAYLGTTKSIDLLQDIKAKLVLAREPGVDRNKINTEISGLKEQLLSTTQAASFSGQNWLHNTSSTAPGKAEIVSSYTRDASGGVSVGSLEIDTAHTMLIDNQNPGNGILSAATTVNQPNGSGGTAPKTYYLVSGGTPAAGTQIQVNLSTSDNDIDGMISAVDEMIGKATDSASTLGAASKSIETQSALTQQLQDSIARSTSNLVDTDMNAESARMKASSVQAQLANQMQSITNANANAILQLFR